MQVYVSSTVGTSTSTDWDMDETDTVRDLVEKVATSQAIDADAMQLVKDGDALEPDQTLKDAGIEDGENLKAVPQARTQGA